MPSDALHRDAPLDEPRSSLPRPVETVRRALQSASFWTAVTLPFVYLPMMGFGLASDHPVAFVGLLVANALTLALGHPHRQRS